MNLDDKHARRRKKNVYYYIYTTLKLVIRVCFFEITN